MSKFEVAITKAQKNPSITFETKKIILTFWYPDENEPFLIEGLCDFSAVDWSNIPLSSNTKFELLCKSGTQLEYIDLGHADPSKDDFKNPRKFRFIKENKGSVTYVLKVFEDKKDFYIAVSQNISATKTNANEKSLFQFHPFQGNYSFDFGFEPEEGPIIYLNKDKLNLIDNWITSDDFLWGLLIKPKALKDGLVHYFQQKNNLAQYNYPWVNHWKAFLESLKIEIDDELFSDGLDEEFINEQLKKAEDIVNAYCEIDKNIEKIQKLMSSVSLEEDD